MIKSLESNEIPFHTNTEEEETSAMPLLVDRTSIEQWRLAGKFNHLKFFF